MNNPDLTSNVDIVLSDYKPQHSASHFPIILAPGFVAARCVWLSSFMLTVCWINVVVLVLTDYAGS